MSVVDLVKVKSVMAFGLCTSILGNLYNALYSAKYLSNIGRTENFGSSVQYMV